METVQGCDGRKGKEDKKRRKRKRPTAVKKKNEKKNKEVAYLSKMREVNVRRLVYTNLAP